MAKNLTKKQKKKLQVFIIILVCLISVGSFIFIKITTPPSLESVIEDVVFDSNEITLDVVLSNKNEEIKYEFVVSEFNKYIKIKKEYNDTIETSIVYYIDNTYYLYKETDTSVTIELKNNDGINMFNSLKQEVMNLSDYLDIDYNSVKYYVYSKEVITFSEYKDNIFYDNELVISDNKLTKITKVFGVNDIVNTVVINIDYNVEILIPN